MSRKRRIFSAPFKAIVAQILRILQPQPSLAFQGILVQLAFCFVVKLSAKHSQFFVHELDDMKTIELMSRILKVLLSGCVVGTEHVCRHGRNL